ncbi:terminase [Veillonella parvula]|jgi:phage terminase small subunit|uniref:terminase n=1 Tax=Veillonella parvula TaxID=29466 RepID=UPI00210E7AA7|nr:terminase [Veillonella parvula]MCB7451654.1 terminase [Veillonella parvula]
MKRGEKVVGRNAKPIDLIMADGNKRHLTKAEIEHRKNTEIRFGNDKLVCPKHIKNNKNAYAKWKELIRLYKDFNFVASGDIGMLGRYCMAYSEYLDLIERRAIINQLSINIEEHYYIEKELKDEGVPEKRIEKMIEKYEFILSIGGLIALDKAINAKMDALVKMEDRLFLNPLAKIKNVPKKPPEEEKTELDQNGFGDI